MSLPQPRTPAGVRALQAIIASPGDTVVGLDFDGTLAPIVDDPEQAYADRAAVRALGRLGERVRAVVVITGRPVRTAVRLGGFDSVPGLGGMVVLGQYGVERWNADGERLRGAPRAGARSSRWRRSSRDCWPSWDWLRLGSSTRAGRSVCTPAPCPIPKRPSPGWASRSGPWRRGTACGSSPAGRCGRSAPRGWTRARRCAPSWPRWEPGR